MNFLTNFINNGMMLDFFSGIIDGIMNLVSGILYAIISGLWAIMDVLQEIFMKLVGLGSVYTNGGEVVTEGGGDLVVWLLTSPLSKSIMTSMMVLGAVLLLVFSTIAIIRSVYKEEKEVPVTKMIGNNIKALMGYLLIPAVCLLGISFSNIILRAVDGATSAGGAPTFSGQVFLSSAYESNLFRNEVFPLASRIKYAQLVLDPVNGGFAQQLGLNYPAGSVSTVDGLEAFATYFDGEFVNNFPNAPGWEQGNQFVVSVTMSGEQAALFRQMSNINSNTFEITMDGNSRSLYCAEKNTWAFYKIKADSFNFLFAFIGTGFMIYIIGMITFGMASRVIQLLFYYLVSPLALSMYPFDDGAVFGNWKKEFISNVVTAYGAVLAMNVYIQVTPLLNSINLFEGGSSNFGNMVVQIVFMIVGGLFVQKFISTLSGWVGGKDAFAEGKSTYEGVKSAPGKMAKSAVKIPLAAGKQTGKFIGNTTGHILNMKARKSAGANLSGAFFGEIGRNIKAKAPGFKDYGESKEKATGRKDIQEQAKPTAKFNKSQKKITPEAIGSSSVIHQSFIDETDNVGARSKEVGDILENIKSKEKTLGKTEVIISSSEEASIKSLQREGLQKEAAQEYLKGDSSKLNGANVNKAKAQRIKEQTDKNLNEARELARSLGQELASQATYKAQLTTEQANLLGQQTALTSVQDGGGTTAFIKKVAGEIKELTMQEVKDKPELANIETAIDKAAAKVFEDPKYKNLPESIKTTIVSEMKKQAK